MLERPAAVTRAVLLDIIPTLDVWRSFADPSAALCMSHWTFLALAAAAAGTDDRRQSRPLARKPLRARSCGGEQTTVRLAGGEQVGEPAPWLDRDVYAHYLALHRDPARHTVHCNDYRAGATVDLDADIASRARGDTITQPLMVLWGSRGNLATHTAPPGRALGGAPRRLARLVPARRRRPCRREPLHPRGQPRRTSRRLPALPPRRLTPYMGGQHRGQLQPPTVPHHHVPRAHPNPADPAAASRPDHCAGARRRRRARARPHSDARSVRRARPAAQSHCRHLDRRGIRRRLCVGHARRRDPRPHRGSSRPAFRSAARAVPRPRARHRPRARPVQHALGVPRTRGPARHRAARPLPLGLRSAAEFRSRSSPPTSTRRKRMFSPPVR